MSQIVVSGGTVSVTTIDELKTYVAFSNERQAFAFETYLKSASRRAFAKKRL
jgi:hypothetical protein